MQRIRGALVPCSYYQKYCWPSEAALSETMQIGKLAPRKPLCLGFLLLLAVSFFTCEAEPKTRVHPAALEKN
jgi:hypothetical protein